MELNTKNRIKIQYYPDGKQFEFFQNLIKGYLKTQFLRNLAKHTNQLANELTMENIIDIQCDLERDFRKRFVLTGEILDFNLRQLYFAKDLKSVRLWCYSNTPTWYATNRQQDKLSEDDLELDVEITLPTQLKISKDLFDFDFSMCETYREEECESYAIGYGVKRLKKCGKQPYEKDLSYFACIW